MHESETSPVSEGRAKEFGRFASVGLVVSAIDYSLLNFFAVMLGLPVLVANSISAPFSGFVSYKLNKKVVFEDRMHSRRKTLLLYSSIVAFGILIVQNAVLHFARSTFADDIAQAAEPLVELVGLGSISLQTITINIAKVCASLVAAVWNYVLLRRFVFVTAEEIND
jgi:putative flippase GtrA